MRIVSPKRIYPPAERCIYCLSVPSDLRREHIIPFGLGGNLILPRASCCNCERITGAIEQNCQRKILGNFRVRHGFPTRNKKERPDKLEINLVTPNGIVSQYVPIRKYPRYLMLFRMPMPGILTGKPATNEFKPDLCMLIHKDDIKNSMNKSWMLGEYRHIDFCLMLAKIAHSYAAAEIGIEALVKYNLLLPKYILNQSGPISHVVGGEIEDPPAANNQLHELKLHNHEGNQRTYLLVSMRLFPYMGAPQYHAVVGERPK